MFYKLSHQQKSGGIFSFYNMTTVVPRLLLIITNETKEQDRTWFLPTFATNEDRHIHLDLVFWTNTDTYNPYILLCILQIYLYMYTNITYLWYLSTCLRHLCGFRGNFLSLSLLLLNFLSIFNNAVF